MRGFEIVWHDALGSTNDEARARAQGGAPHGTVVCARRQTAGRGRQARPWVSPPGNLYASLLLRTEVAPIRTAEIGFVAALAVADTVDAFLPPDRRAALKWPNDVLVDGAKIAGILLERGEAPAPPGAWVVVGMGVNLASAPDGLPYPATSLAVQGGAPPAEEALARLLDSFGTRLAAWGVEGFAPVRAEWLRRAMHAPGRPARVTFGKGTVTGLFAGLAPDGALLLETEEGVRRVVAGDVS